MNISHYYRVKGTTSKQQKQCASPVPIMCIAQQTMIFIIHNIGLLHLYYGGIKIIVYKVPLAIGLKLFGEMMEMSFLKCEESVRCAHR